MEDQSYHQGVNTGVSDGTHSGNRGVQENYRRQARVQHEANKLGETLTAGVAALFLHPVFSFVGFWLLGFGTLIAIAPTIGVAASLHGLPTWYGCTAAAIPLVLAVVLRKIVRKLMAAIFVAGVAALIVIFVMEVIELRSERAARAEATPEAPQSAAPQTRPPTPAEIRQALSDAGRSEVKTTAPAQGPVGEVESYYCSAPARADRPEWCP